VSTRPGLFDPVTLNGLTVPHRLWVAPMCQYSSVDGMPNDWHLVHLGSFAIGRAGLIMTEAAAVCPEGRISPDDAGIWNEDQTQGWARVVDFVHHLGGLIGVQISHAGRKASTYAPARGRGSVPPEEGGWATVGPSATPFGTLATPQALDRAGLEQVVADFADAADRAVRAGFDLIELHGAHGYLLSQFLSPTSNLRTDGYGGDLTGRTRLVREVVEAVRGRIPAGMPLVLRISATEWVDGGVTVQDTIETLRQLPGLDLVSITSGGNHADQQIPTGPGYQQPLAREVRAALDVPIGVAGLITTPEHADAVVGTGDADVVYVARQFLREPTFSLRAAATLGHRLPSLPQYARAPHVAAPA
jgi:2,4-dienoyl-CoA reductase-like NADH-dependent reductase (Old Yellow Enzyme family)